MTDGMQQRIEVPLTDPWRKRVTRLTCKCVEVAGGRGRMGGFVQFSNLPIPAPIGRTICSCLQLQNSERTLRTFLAPTMKRNSFKQACCIELGENCIDSNN